MATALATPLADDLAGYAAAMRRGFEGDITANAGLPRYSLSMSINPSEGVLTGAERIVFPNRTGAPLVDLALRLYPNFPRDALGKGGDVRMDVTGAAVDGRPVAIADAARHTAVLLPLAPPLPPEQSATLALTWTATIKAWGDGAWPLPSYYPMLAVHERDGWRLDITNFPDRVYAESALYDATIEVPAALTIAASGSTVASERRGGRTIYQVYTGPVREFALTVGDFDVQHDTVGDVGVNVYTARGSPLEARSIARVAAGALADFDRRFGSYRYRELDIHLLIGDYDGGDEYPGLILLYSGGPVSARTRYVAAHEVAHQWWYGIVGNDIYRQPWLDEAFAQYSGILYAEDVAGAAIATADWEREVERRYRGALLDGDRPIGLAIDDYGDFNVYYRTVYGKGALFLRALREQLGDPAFFAALQRYYARHRYGIATTDDVRRAFEEASGRDLGALFRGWVTGA
jgi:aminopeptidase N